MSKPEVINSALEVAPYIGAGLGVAAGILAERLHYLPRIEVRDQDRSEAYSGVNEQIPTQPLSARLINGIGIMGVVGLASGTLAGAAIQREAGPAFEDPSIGYVIDGSGATLYGQDEKKPADRIKELVESFNRRSEDANTVAVLASGNQDEEYKLGEINGQRKSGDAPMKHAFSSATNRLDQIKAEGDFTSTSTAVVVMTNGNSFARSSAVQRAKKSNTPVYVVNVADEENKTATDSKKIAKATDGSYWDKNANPDEVSEKIFKELEPSERADIKHEKDLGSRALLGLVTLITAGSFIKTRLKMPRNLTGTKIKR